MLKPALACLILLASTVPSGRAGFSEELEGKLVKLSPGSGELVEYELPASPQTKYFLIYFSAHWCAPCRKMTPAMVGFYHELKETHPEVELIFVSADRDAGAMVRYANWAQMPWPALAWDERESIPAISELRPRAIPYIALFDAGGGLLGASDTGGFNVGVPKIINALQEELGLEIYDVQERHGKRSPLIPVAYALAGLFAVVMVARRWIGKRS
ncbi:MAG: thioredoxin-like domain-containing protein [Verrucomicrobiales bacterium]